MGSDSQWAPNTGLKVGSVARPSCSRIFRAWAAILQIAQSPIVDKPDTLTGLHIHGLVCIVGLGQGPAPQGLPFVDDPAEKLRGFHGVVNGGMGLCITE